MSPYKHIPNLFTLMNLVSGCVGLVALQQQNLSAAALFIFIAAVFDFLDGTAARLLSAGSELGKQLDSLADVVSFGVLPALIMFKLSSQAAGFQYPGVSWVSYLPYVTLVLAGAAATRLAKFNLDTRQGVHFLGLPTPAAALFFTSFPLIIFFHGHAGFPGLDNWLRLFFDPFLLTALCVLFAILMLVEMPLFSLKMKNFAWHNNHYKYVFLLLSLPCIYFLRLGAALAIVPLYILLSVAFRGSFAQDMASPGEPENQ